MFENIDHNPIKKSDIFIINQFLKLFFIFFIFIPVFII